MEQLINAGNFYACWLKSARRTLLTWEWGFFRTFFVYISVIIITSKSLFPGCLHIDKTFHNCTKYLDSEFLDLMNYPFLTFARKIIRVVHLPVYWLLFAKFIISDILFKVLLVNFLDIMVKKYQKNSQIIWQQTFIQVD